MSATMVEYASMVLSSKPAMRSGVPAHLTAVCLESCALDDL